MTNIQKVPDFLIIGAQKAGTSSLYYYLSQHPGLLLPAIKELHFFDLNYSRGLDWYLKQFPEVHPETSIITGEASPYYLYHPLAAERIARHCPDVKLIIMLRNPADRAFSHYMMQKTGNIEPSATFEEAILLEPGRLKDEVDKMLADTSYYSLNHQKFSYLDRGFYSIQILHWMKYFASEQFLLIRSEDFFHYPAGELTSVFDFLGINHVLPSDLKPVNTNSYEQMNQATRIYLDSFYALEKRRLAGIFGHKYLWNDVHY
jgi:hypothetical protein